MRALTVVGLCLFAAQASAAAGGGRIAVTPGWKWVPQEGFYFGAAGQGYSRRSTTPGGPQLSGTFAYSATDEIEVAIDPFVAGELLQLEGLSDLRVYSYGALLGVRFQWPFDSGFSPFAGLWLGPQLTYVQGGDAAPMEVLSQALGASAGMSWQFDEHWGVSLEYRFLAAGTAATPHGPVLGGGHTLSIGVVFFVDKETHSERM